VAFDVVQQLIPDGKKPGLLQQMQTDLKLENVKTLTKKATQRKGASETESSMANADTECDELSFLTKNKFKFGVSDRKKDLRYS
jgi:hypothetical protein